MWQEHIRITARFDLGPSGAPKEQASCTLAFKPGVVGTFSTESNRQSMVNDAFDDWSAFVTNSSSGVLDSVRLKECRLYKIGTDGKSEFDTAVSDRDPVAGVVGSNPHPWQVSNVITLVAGARGKGRFGRIYLPPQGFAIDRSTDTMNTTDFGYLWGAAQTLLAALSDKPLIDAGWKLAVAGQTGSGTLREVTQIRMGHVADTQRRRRRSVPEAYTVADFSG